MLDIIALFVMKIKIIDRYTINSHNWSLEIPIKKDHYNEGRLFLDITTRIEPEKNTPLNGLYKSKSIYCTKCEAQGFRKITYFTDSPDATVKYQTTIHADETTCPVLLSNGNLIKLGYVYDMCLFFPPPSPFLNIICDITYQIVSFFCMIAEKKQMDDTLQFGKTHF
ncbi:hypothetical protein RFI_35953 [Reticulomyxa filosa]|uniref:Aminopeptidase N-like N-terminal domain-containing protein n=1 Tax=Reticulomyxa filosa TaxID=46433 RepID=X6LIR0_RETFI|nr:hypothetical protein RFI_35953 [Reticulomyxa filosa]|eukprot:ETO01489.1 hypothetical protein RFI_35953 [Reticulomyxa filosa]